MVVRSRSRERSIGWETPRDLLLGHLSRKVSTAAVVSWQRQTKLMLRTGRRRLIMAADPPHAFPFRFLDPP